MNGYKVMHSEKGKKQFKRYCFCNTYELAKFTVKHYARPPNESKIVPITKKELIKIQSYCPFDFP